MIRCFRQSVIWGVTIYYTFGMRWICFFYGLVYMFHGGTGVISVSIMEKNRLQSDNTESKNMESSFRYESLLSHNTKTKEHIPHIFNLNLLSKNATLPIMAIDQAFASAKQKPVYVFKVKQHTPVIRYKRSNNNLERMDVVSPLMPETNSSETIISNGKENLQGTENDTHPSELVTNNPQNEAGGVLKVIWWRELLDKSQLVMAVCGFFANVATFATLVKNGQEFSPAILILLRHQSMVDSWACMFGSLVLLQPSMWVTGSYALDRFICHAWHGQGIYWGAVFISIWNLVTLAFERYLAVCHPFKHQDLTTGKLYGIFAFIYVVSVFATCGANLQVDLVDGHCVAQDFLKGPAGKRFYYGFSISTFFTFYSLPCSFIFTFYGLVIFAFYRRRQQSQLASSRVIDKATAELTKTAVTVTCIFIIAIGYDIWYFLLGYVGIVEYVVNSPLQKIGIWLSCFNSVANPFVYALLMPLYRRSIAKTFFSCLKKNSARDDQKRLANNHDSRSTSLASVIF